MNLKLTREELEEANEALSGEGWDIVLTKYFKPLIEGLHEQLVESASTEDEKLKGTIQAIKRYVLPLRDEFKKMLQEVMKEEGGKEKK